jgi:hypothetical protein
MRQVTHILLLKNVWLRTGLCFSTGKCATLATFQERNSSAHCAAQNPFSKEERALPHAFSKAKICNTAKPLPFLPPLDP